MNVFERVRNIVGFSLGSLAGFYIICVMLASICAYIIFPISYLNPELIADYVEVGRGEFKAVSQVHDGKRLKTVIRFKDGSVCDLAGRRNVYYSLGSQIRISHNPWAQGSDRYRIEKVK